MIFEIPINHFPVTRTVANPEGRPEPAHTILRRARCRLYTASCQELSRIVVAEKPEETQPARARIQSFFDAEETVRAPVTMPVARMVIARSQSVPAVPRDRNQSVTNRAERIQKSIAAFTRRVSTLLSIPVVTA